MYRHNVGLVGVKLFRTRRSQIIFGSRMAESGATRIIEQRATREVNFAGTATGCDGWSSERAVGSAAAAKQEQQALAGKGRTAIFPSGDQVPTS
jgi:aryl-alcohol dehydrogenase-like predicted oxidoreductase